MKCSPRVKFHDGDELTSADVKASWDRVVFPQGTVSVRKSAFNMIKNIEAPEKYTVVFNLKEPSPTFLNFAAHPTLTPNLT